MGHVAAKLTFPFLLALLLALTGCATAPRMQSNFCQSDHDIVLAPAVTAAIAEAAYLFEQNPDDPAAAMAPLDRVIAKCGRRLTGLSKAKVYEKRGQLKARSNDRNGAIADYETALATNALPTKRTHGLRAKLSMLEYSKPGNNDNRISDFFGIATDRDAQPLLRVPPETPKECERISIRNGISYGYV